MKKILVVQFRTDQSKEHEQSCFHQEFPNIWEDFEFVDAIQNDLPTDLSPYYAIVFAGSGEFNYPLGHGVGTWKEPVFEFTQKVIESGIYTLGICFGFQTIALQQGAKMVNDASMKEVGTYPVYLTEAGKQDELFEDMPTNFKAQFGHKDTAVDFPDHFIQLGGSEKVECNAFRLKDTHVWGVLYHPELNPDRMRYRVTLFPSYVESGDPHDVFDALDESPASTQVLHRFLRHAKNRAN